VQQWCLLECDRPSHGRSWTVKPWLHASACEALPQVLMCKWHPAGQWICGVASLYKFKQTTCTCTHARLVCNRWKMNRCCCDRSRVIQIAWCAGGKAYYARHKDNDDSYEVPVAERQDSPAWAGRCTLSAGIMPFLLWQLPLPKVLCCSREPFLGRDGSVWCKPMCASSSWYESANCTLSSAKAAQGCH